MEEFDFKSSFELINKLVQSDEGIHQNIDMSKIEKIIKKDIQDKLKEDAPYNFPELIFNFNYEFDKLNDFIMFNKLINKNIVSLGGSFSTGKSTFLNSLIGKKVLPSKVEPSTSVPTYIIKGEENIFAVNSFMKNVKLETEDLKVISHGFSDEYPIRFGHLLRNIFLETTSLQYEKIAFLDTPGYSKPDTEYYSDRTDENIARAQLNSSDYILWFVNVEAGTITQEDIKFLNTLKKEIPKLIVVNKCDKKDMKNVQLVLAQIRDTTANNGICIEGVIPYSCRYPEKYGIDEIKEKLLVWDKEIVDFTFSKNFKILFLECKKYFEDKIRDEAKRLNRLNKALTFSENDEVVECLSSLSGEIKVNIKKYKEKEEQLERIQNDFFKELKNIGDMVGIKVPEISELDLIESAKDTLQVVREFKLKNKIKDTDYNQIIRTMIVNLENKYIDNIGNRDYKNNIKEVLESINTVNNNMKEAYGGDEYSNTLLNTMNQSIVNYIEKGC